MPDDGSQELTEITMSNYKRIRRHKNEETESREDYLEAAYVLKLRKGYVRNAMICRYMGYSQASISVGIKMLREDGYLVRDSDGFLDITEKGETLAKKI